MEFVDLVAALYKVGEVKALVDVFWKQWAIQGDFQDGVSRSSHILMMQSVRSTIAHAIYDINWNAEIALKKGGTSKETKEMIIHARDSVGLAAAELKSDRVLRLVPLAKFERK